MIRATVVVIGLVLATAIPTIGLGSAQNAVPPAVARADLSLRPALSSEQARALSRVYPDFRLLAMCQGRFSGGSERELVAGVWKPVEAEEKWKREVHRVGLVWTGKSWEVHVIDDEIEHDRRLSRSFPLSWEYTLGDDRFEGRMKCGVESEVRRDPDLVFERGRQPFFDLQKPGSPDRTVVCFATSDVYNNWDCVAYKPDESRFALWFQQVHAD